MSLFGPPNQSVKSEQIAPTLQKRSIFRQKLRKSEKDRKFTQVRKQLISSLKSLKFLEQIKSQINNLTIKQLPQLIQCFDAGLNNAVFYQNVINMNIQHYLCEFIKENGQRLSLNQKNKIMRGLVQLTYYCRQGYKAIIEDELIDWVKREIQIIRQNQFAHKHADIQEQQSDFIYLGTTLAMNLTAVGDKQFNYYLMETDLINAIIYYIDKKSRNRTISPESLYHLRSSLLKLYINLFNEKIHTSDFILKNIEQILSDQFYLQANTQDVLKCVLRVSQIQGIFPQFLKGRYYCDFIRSIEKHIKRANQTQDFVALEHLVNFLINLFESQNTISQSAALQLISLMPQRLILHALDYFLQNPTHNNINYSGKWIKVIYYCMQDNPASVILCQNDRNNDEMPCSVIIPTKIDINKLIGIILHHKNTFHIRYGKYCVALLVSFLHNLPFSMDIMIDNGVIDQIEEILTWNQFYNQTKVETFELVKALIQTQQTIYKSYKNRMLQSLQGKGIIRQIEKLQDAQSRLIYKKAEQTMQWIAQIKKQR